MEHGTPLPCTPIETFLHNYPVNLMKGTTYYEDTSVRLKVRRTVELFVGSSQSKFNRNLPMLFA